MSKDVAAREYHPASMIFPLMDDQAIQQLADDIRANGLLMPIMLHHDGRIIDGRNRQTACILAGVDPDYETCGETDEHEIAKLVLSLNLARRQLTPSQLSMVGGRSKAYFEELAKERKRESGRQYGRGQKVPVNLPEPIGDAGDTRDETGASVGVSGKSIDYATKVIRHGSKELQDAVDQGNVTVSAAAQLADLPKREQTKVINDKRSGDRQAVKKALADPRPTYPLSTGFVKITNDIVAALNLVRADCGTMPEMFASPDWDDDATSHVVQQIHSLAATFRDMKKELT